MAVTTRCHRVLERQPRASGGAGPAGGGLDCALDNGAGQRLCLFINFSSSLPLRPASMFFSHLSRLMNDLHARFAAGRDPSWSSSLGRFRAWYEALHPSADRCLSRCVEQRTVTQSWERARPTARAFFRGGSWRCIRSWHTSALDMEGSASSEGYSSVDSGRWYAGVDKHV